MLNLERLDNCKSAFERQFDKFDIFRKESSDVQSPPYNRIVEKIRDDLQKNLETIFGAFEVVVEAFNDDDSSEPVKIQWPTSCSIIGNQRQKFEANSSLNFKDENGNILPEEKLLCERVSPSSGNAFDQFNSNIPTYIDNVEDKLTSKIRDAFEKSEETIGDGFLGIYFGTFEGYHYKFPCEATPSDCNSFNPRTRPWFLDAQKDMNKKLRVENSCEQLNVSGFSGAQIIDVLKDLHKCQVELAEDCASEAFPCLSCDGEDMTLNGWTSDWNFKEKLEQSRTLNATLWELKFNLLDTNNSKSVLGLQYNDAFRFGEINTISRLTEKGVIGLDIDILTRGPKLKNPLFKGIFDSNFKSEIFFLDSSGSFVYHPQILVDSGAENRYKEDIKENICGRIDLTYEDLGIFYEESDALALKEDIKRMVDDESKDSTVSEDKYEIFRITTTKSTSLLMVVKYFDGEKEALDKIIEWGEILEEKLDLDTDVPNCSLIIDQKVCFGEKNSPSVLMDAIEKLPNNERLRSKDGTGIFKSSDSVNDALTSLGQDQFINLNINAGKEAVNKILKNYTEYMTNAAINDVHKFNRMPVLLNNLYDSLIEPDSCEELYRVVAVTPSGLLYSYPHYEVNADYPAMFESWYISAWKEDGIQNESRETDGYDVISKAFYDGQELLFVLAVHLKHPNSTIRGWPQITKQIATKFYEPVSMSLDETVSSSRSYDCSAAEELADLPEFYSFLDRDELMKARKELDEGCNRITSFIPELISCILTVVIIVATIIILKWYHKKERRAKTELQEGNPLQANQQSTNCIIL